MIFAVEIQIDDGYCVDEARLRAAACCVLSQHDTNPDTGLTIVITDNKSVAALNHQFRGVDSATDVLSFPADPPPVAPDDEPPYLGDIIIAYPYSAEQATCQGHDTNDNLALLVVHGTLHLLGYDHDTPTHRADMWKAQETALVALQLSLDMIPALENTGHDH